MNKLCPCCKQCRGLELLIWGIIRYSLRHATENKWSWRADSLLSLMARLLETRIEGISTHLHSKCPKRDWTDRHLYSRLKRNARTHSRDILQIWDLSLVTRIAFVNLISILEQVLRKRNLLLGTQASKTRTRSERLIEVFRVKRLKLLDKDWLNTGILHTTLLRIALRSVLETFQIIDLYYRTKQ